MKPFYLVILLAFSSFFVTAQTGKVNFPAPSENCYMNGIYDLGEKGYLVLFVDFTPIKEFANVHVKYISANNEQVWEKFLPRDMIGPVASLHELTIKSVGDYIYFIKISPGTGNYGYISIIQLDLKNGNVQNKMLKDYGMYKRVFATEVTNENLVFFQWVEKGFNEANHEYYIHLLDHKTLGSSVKHTIAFPLPPDKPGYHYGKWIYFGIKDGNYYFYKKFGSREGQRVTDITYHIVAVDRQGKVVRELKVAPVLDNGKYLNNAQSPHINQGYFFSFDGFDRDEGQTQIRDGIGTISDIYLDEATGDFYVTGSYGDNPYSYLMEEKTIGSFISKYNENGEKQWSNEGLVTDLFYNYNLRLDRKNNTLTLLFKNYSGNYFITVQEIKTQVVLMSADGSLIGKCSGRQPKLKSKERARTDVVIYHNEDDQLLFIPDVAVKQCQSMTGWSKAHAKIVELSKNIPAGKEAYFYIKPLKDKDIVVEYRWEENAINAYIVYN